MADSSEALRARRHACAQNALFSLRRQALAQSPLDRDRVEALMEPHHLMRELRASGCGSTTHISVATASGELVAVTLSNGYGSGITIPGTGIACNNSLGEPELNPAGLMAAPAGSRLVSNMAPSIARHGDGHAFAFGSPGASRITTAMAQMWERHTGEGMALAEAIAAPRLHLNAEAEPVRLLCEPGINTSLLEKDFCIQRFDAANMYFGGIKLAGIDRHGELQAYADERREGCVTIVE
jgi:gamma-glutamyltranspeptidase/glutathione hydrolase